MRTLSSNIIITLLVIIVVIIFLTVSFLNSTAIYKSASGQSYMKGNNTVANVTAIIDLNDEKGWYSKDNPLWYKFPNEYEWTVEDINCKLYGECDVETNKTKKNVVAIEVDLK
jgi:hypothetical protein